MKNILVNPNKVQRANEIIAFLSGGTKTPEEVNLRDKFAALIKEDEVDEKDYLEYIYTKLGGLVRTEEEEKKAKVRAAKMKSELEGKKGKKAKKDDDDE